MKLTYSIPDKLYYIENFLDYSTYKKLHYDVFRDKTAKLHSTKDSWDARLRHGHKTYVENFQLYVNYDPMQEIKNLLKDNPFHKIKSENFNFIAHSMKSGSGINWHNDYNHEYGITYYINHRWNPKFGGELMFATENTKGFLPLKGNSIIIIKTPLEHKVTPVMNSIVPRKTIQIFIDK